MNIELVLPNDFMGAVEIIPNHPDALRPIWKNNTVTLRIPESGVLNLGGADPFSKWHTTEARYEDGRTIQWYGEELDDELLAIASADEKNPCGLSLGSVDSSHRALPFQQIYIGTPKECWEALSSSSRDFNAGERVVVSDEE